MNTTMWVGTQFRCANEKIVDLGVFESMLAAMAYACGPLTLTDYFTCTTSGIGQQRSVSTPENLVRLWNRKTTVELHLQSSRRMDDGPYASVFFGRSDRPGGEVPPTSGEVTLYRTVSGDEHANFLLGLKRAFVLADGWSGHVHATTEGAFAYGETGFNSMRPWRRWDEDLPEIPLSERGKRSIFDRPPHAEDTNDRVELVRTVRSRVGPRVRGTYWGTLLGPALVEELGGLAGLIRDAPVVVAEPLGNGGAYLQLTPTPEPITTETMQRGLLALERFLQPVLVPTPPYWATRTS